MKKLGLIIGKLMIAVMAIMLVSCKSTVRTIPLADYSKHQIEDDVILYSLPKNSLSINFQVKERHEIPGIFSAYAPELLGVDPEISEEDRSYELIQGDLRSGVVKDPAQYYLIVNASKSVLSKPLFNLDGFLVSFNEGGLMEIDEELLSDPGQSKFVIQRRTDSYFVKGLSERIDTTFKMVRNDSLGFIKHPIMRKVVVAKPDRDKAADIANQLLDLQQEKMSIMLGDENELPDGKAFEIVFREYDKIEAKYLPLFYGRVEESSETVEFTLIPELTQLDTALVLGYFSKENGFSTKGSAEAERLYIWLTNESRNDLLTELHQHLDTI
jgi:hypothetical protein